MLSVSYFGKQCQITFLLRNCFDLQLIPSVSLYIIIAKICRQSILCRQAARSHISLIFFYHPSVRYCHILLLCRQTTPNMPLGFVYFKYSFCLIGQVGVYFYQSFRHVFMYGRLIPCRFCLRWSWGRKALLRCRPQQSKRAAKSFRLPQFC